MNDSYLKSGLKSMKEEPSNHSKNNSMITMNLRRFKLLGVDIQDMTLSDAVRLLMDAAQKNISVTAGFVNADCLNQAYRDTEYRDILNNFDVIFADGSGIRLACRLNDWAIPNNVNGTDLFPLLCQALAETGLSLYLLGGQPQVAETAALNMQKKYPQLKIAGTQHGYYHRDELPAILKQINQSGAAVLLVGFGAPNQERWLQTHRNTLQIPVRLGVGGLFDYYSDRIPRAPLWLRDRGLEWTWRLWQEPARLWKRYILGNPLFVFRVLTERYLKR
jgi:exopolysaccharide biosynthesis WecB/TagA/CpsF family protein